MLSLKGKERSDEILTPEATLKAKNGSILQVILYDAENGPILLMATRRKKG